MALSGVQKFLPITSKYTKKGLARTRSCHRVHLTPSHFCPELVSKCSLWPLTLFLSFWISWIRCHLHQRATHPQCRHRCPKGGTSRVTLRKEPVLTSSRDRFTQKDYGVTFKIKKNLGRLRGFNHTPNKGGSIKHLDLCLVKTETHSEFRTPLCTQAVQPSLGSFGLRSSQGAHYLV